MNISGKVYQILAEVKGEGKNGPWSRQDFVVETEDQFPKKVCISVWNNKISLKELQPGDKVNVEINVESREYNGRWYTDVKASGLSTASAREQKEEDAQQAPWQTNSDKNSPLEPINLDEDSPGDDLPF